MNPKFLTEATLSYYAVYDQELREEMEEYGLISDVDEERAPGVKPYRSGPTGAEVRADASAAERRRSEKGAKLSGWKDRTGKTEGPLITVNPGDAASAAKALERTKQKPHSRTGNPTRIMGGPLTSDKGLATTRTADNIRGMIRGPKSNNPVASTITQSSRPKPSREIIRKPKPQAEEYDIYDIVLSHLLDEGYASTVENAEAIMVNMSENWIESILG